VKRRKPVQNKNIPKHAPCLHYYGTKVKLQKRMLELTTNACLKLHTTHQGYVDLDETAKSRENIDMFAVKHPGFAFVTHPPKSQYAVLHFVLFLLVLFLKWKSRIICVLSDSNNSSYGALRCASFVALMNKSDM
jgi:hypothetical protein